MNSITIVLGGKSYLVQRLTIGADAAWRETAKPIVEPITEIAMAAQLANPKPEEVARLAVASSLFVDPLATLNAVLAYSPALEAEREWIENHAYADEALAALLALFFGMGAPTSMQTGAAPRPQPTMSPN
jgi:hypothetical protein